MRDPLTRMPDRKPTRTSIRLCRAIRAAGLKLDYPDDNYCIRRTYAGCHQRSAGAWSWSLETINYTCSPDIGSQWTVAELLSSGFVIEDEHGGFALVPK